MNCVEGDVFANKMLHTDGDGCDNGGGDETEPFMEAFVCNKSDCLQMKPNSVITFVKCQQIRF